jgi:hypothetical protein
LKIKSPINWLQGIDEAAKAWEPMENWHDPRSRFLLVRYPHLRPTYGDAEKELSWIWKHLRKWDFAIESDMPQVLRDLSSDQRMQLAALLSDSMDRLEHYKRDYADRRWHKDRKRYGAAWQRKLDRKAEIVRRDVERWMNEAVTPSRNALVGVRNTEVGEMEIFKKRRVREIHPDINTASQILELLAKRQHYIPTEEDVRILDEVIASLTYKNPASMGMVMLYWFFRHECACSGDEAEVRTALIRNKYWKSFVPSVRYIPRYADAENKGCNAVRRAVAQFRWDLT